MRWICTHAHEIKSSPSVRCHISVNLLFSFTELSLCETVVMQGDCYPISTGLLTSFSATPHCSSSPLIPLPLSLTLTLSLPPLPLRLFKDTAYPVPSCLCSRHSSSLPPLLPLLPPIPSLSLLLFSPVVLF